MNVDPSTWFPHGWERYLVGGALVGTGTALIFLTTGIRAGASGFFTTLWSYLSPRETFQREWIRRERSWRTWLTLGLVLGAALVTLFLHGAAFVTEVSPLRLTIGGVLVGFGTRLSRGCTSGHGICGLSAGSRASFTAVVTFLAVAIGTAQLLRALVSG